jgi:carbonic anhydrase
LLTQTEPGELFILRNAGNIVPPYGGGGGEEATIEYAVAGLKIRHIVLCGHSSCGAMHGLLEPGAVATMPSVARWLGHSKPIVSEVQQATAGLSPQNRLRLTIEKNVLLQIENLQTHPTVKAALDRGEIKLHPWVYDFATGEVQVHNRESNRFVSLGDRNVPGGKGPDGVETSTLPSNSM